MSQSPLLKPLLVFLWLQNCKEQILLVDWFTLLRAFKHQKLQKEKPLKLKLNELLKKVSVQSGNYQNVNWLISQNLFINLAVMRKQTPVPFLKTYYKMFQDMASKQHKCTMIYIDQPPLPSLTSLILMRFIDWSNYSYLVKNF